MILQSGSKKREAENENLFPAGFKPKIHLFTDMVEELGWSKILTEVLPWMFYRRYLFFSQRIDYPSDIPESPIPFQLSIMKEYDIEKVLTLRDGFHNPDILRHRLRKGHICFIGWNNDRPVHLRWLFTRSVYISFLQRTLVLSQGEIYGAETYTIPEFRKFGILVHAGFLVRQYLKKWGYHRILCTVASWNSYIHRYAARMKYQKVGEVEYLNLLGFRRYFWKGGIKMLNPKEISILTDP